MNFLVADQPADHLLSCELFTADEISIFVKTAVSIVRERFDILSKTAPAAVLEYLQIPDNNCSSMLNQVDELLSDPMSLAKVFLADLAVYTTRVWEGFVRSSAEGSSHSSKLIS